MLRKQVEKNQNPLEKEIAWKQVVDLFPEFNSFIHLTHHIHLDTVNDFLREPIQNICKDITDSYDAGKRVFVFECIKEAIDLDHILKVHRIVELIKTRTESSHFLYVTSMNDGIEAYQRIRERYSLPDYLNILSCNYAEYKTQKIMTVYKYTGPYKPYYKKKNFLHYTNTTIENRLPFLDAGLESQLITRPITSTVNWNDVECFELTHVSIVVETPFYDRTDTRYKFTGGAETGIHLSETTYNCFPLKHPFILVGRPGVLEYLKKQGYKTFHPLIDETYDTITNDDERMKAIQKEITRLSLLNGKEWVLLTEQLIEKVEHNRAHFFNQRNFKNETDAFTKIQLSLINNEAKQLAFIANANKPLKSVDCGIPPSVVLKHEHGEMLVIPLMWITKEMGVIREHTLSNGTVMRYPMYLEGHTTFIRDEIVKVIRKYTPAGTKYNRGLAWCAGTGVSGFEFLINGLSNHMTFTDILDTAMDSVNANAHSLGFINKIETHVTPMISRLPEVEKFDFVFGSPPSSVNYFNHTRFITNEKHNVTIEEITNSARQCVDHNWEIHGEFFKNIGKRLVDGADVFVLELSSDETLIKLGELHGFKFINAYDLRSIQHCTIMHYKKVK